MAMVRSFGGFGIVCATVHAQSAEPVRVGILGFDNYQAVEYVQFFNNPKAEGDLAGLRVVAAYPVTSADYPESAALTERWQKQMLSAYQNPTDPKDKAPPVALVGSIDELLN